MFILYFLAQIIIAVIVGLDFSLGMFLIIYGKHSNLKILQYRTSIDVDMFLMNRDINVMATHMKAMNEEIKTGREYCIKSPGCRYFILKINTEMRTSLGICTAPFKKKNSCKFYHKLHKKCYM